MYIFKKVFLFGLFEVLVLFFHFLFGDRSGELTDVDTFLESEGIRVDFVANQLLGVAWKDIVQCSALFGFKIHFIIYSINIHNHCEIITTNSPWQNGIQRESTFLLFHLLTFLWLFVRSVVEDMKGSWMTEKHFSRSYSNQHLFSIC